MRNEAEREEEEERERADQPDQARIEIVQRGDNNNNNDAHFTMLFNTLLQLIQMMHEQMNALRAQVRSMITRMRHQTWLLERLVDLELHPRRTQMRRSSAPFAVPEGDDDIDVVGDADDEESLHHLIEHELPRIDLERE